MSKASKKDVISIVTSVYKVAPYVDDFYKRNLKAIKKTKCDYEFIFVIDGSPDNALDVLTKIAKSDPKVKVVELSRNFGQQPAMMQGIELAQGDFVYTLDCDLEEDPEHLVDFYETLTSQSNKDDPIDLVYGVRQKRNDPPIRRAFSTLFYKVFKHLSGIKDHNNVLFTRLMTRRYVDVLLSYDEAHLFFPGLLEYSGFRQVPKIIEKKYKGHTSYTFMKRLKVGFEGILSFTTKPLVYIMISGFVLSLSAMALAIVLLLKAAFFDDFSPGWPSVIVSIWFFGGANLFALGVVGLYIGQVFEQVKKRPRTIIKKIHVFK